LQLNGPPIAVELLLCRTRNHTKSTVCSKNSFAETYSKSQLYIIHCITKKCRTLLPAVGKLPVQTHCTKNYTPVIQELSSSFNTLDRFTQKSTNKSNYIQQIRNVRRNRYRVLRLRSVSKALAECRNSVLDEFFENFK